ncbi:MAG: DUF3552 domain-containing protein, partial [Dehalococcoidia bacterium]|nr:DUF3552 domain-containing protein [Dehalococcoidia bacterium]
MDPIVLALIAVGGFALGGIVIYLVLQVAGRGALRRAHDEAENVVGDARREARELTLVAEKEALERRDAAEQEAREARREVTRSERRMEQREEALERRGEKLEATEQSVQNRIAKIEVGERELQESSSRLRNELERIAQLTADEAREQLMAALDGELREESARRVRAMESSAKADGDTRARKMLATVMQRMTSEITAETTVSTLPLPSDELKGRIIGREGRNIRAFEAATGCDLIIDDTPGSVTVSGFDPVRREIARLALSRLVQDGRIQ